MEEEPIEADSPKIEPEREQIIPFFPSKADSINPEMFLLVEGQRLTKEAQVALLKDTEEILGCSQYQLAKLLGMEIRNYSAHKQERRSFGSGR